MRSAKRAAIAIISQVPRLEPVARLLDAAADPSRCDFSDELERSQVELLRLSFDLDQLEMSGASAADALRAAQSQGRYSPALLKAVGDSMTQNSEGVQRSKVPLSELRPGMVLDQDVYTDRKILIAPRGCEVTGSFLEHILNFSQQMENNSIAVLVPQAGADLAAA
jgi:hypothetical protein